MNDHTPGKELTQRFTHTATHAYVGTAIEVRRMIEAQHAAGNLARLVSDHPEPVISVQVELFTPAGALARPGEGPLPQEPSRYNPRYNPEPYLIATKLALTVTIALVILYYLAWAVTSLNNFEHSVLGWGAGIFDIWAWVVACAALCGIRLTMFRLAHLQ